MKKKLLTMGIVLSLVFSMTGCMDMTVEDKISNDGTYTVKETTSFAKEALQEYVTKLQEDGATTTYEECEKQMIESGYSLQTKEDGKEYFVKEEVDSTTIVKEIKGSRLSNLDGSYQIWESGIKMNIKKANEGALTEESDESLADLYDNTHLEYRITFDREVEKTDAKGTIDSEDPKTAVWTMTYSEFLKMETMEAYCKSDITVSGVKQGATYKGTKKVKFTGAKTATYNGKKVKSGAKYKKTGQHTIILKAASGEQRTVSFFMDNTKPKIKGIKKNKKYKKGTTFTVSDKHSGIASVKINGKKQSSALLNYQLKKKGKNTITVKDNVGNVTKIKVTVKKK